MERLSRAQADPFVFIENREEKDEVPATDIQRLQVGHVWVLFLLLRCLYEAPVHGMDEFDGVMKLPSENEPGFGYVHQNFILAVIKSSKLERTLGILFLHDLVKVLRDLEMSTYVEQPDYRGYWRIYPSASRILSRVLDLGSVLEELVAPRPPKCTMPSGIDSDNPLDAFPSETCESAEHFIRSVGELTQGPDVGWLFRGQADYSWPLVPSALRDSERDNWNDIKHSDQVVAEYNRLHEFYRAVDIMGLCVPDDNQNFRTQAGFDNHYRPKIERAQSGDDEWIFDEMLSVAALAQHYGIKTRLLDWTFSPLVAAYFASCESASWLVDEQSLRLLDDQMMCVWALNYDWIIRIFSHVRAPVIIVTAPHASNPNLHAQRGVFTLDRSRDIDPILLHFPSEGRHSIPVRRQPLDRSLKNYVNNLSTPEDIIRDNGVSIMVQLKLHISEAPRLLRILAERTNIHAGTVYEGFPGATKLIDEKKMYDDLT